MSNDCETLRQYYEGRFKHNEAIAVFHLLIDVNAADVVLQRSANAIYEQRLFLEQTRLQLIANGVFIPEIAEPNTPTI